MLIFDKYNFFKYLYLSFTFTYSIQKIIEKPENIDVYKPRLVLDK